MLKEIMYCDRCGKELKGHWHNHGLHLCKRKYFLRNVFDDDEILDLCSGCYTSLRDWFDKGKLKNQTTHTDC